MTFGSTNGNPNGKINYTRDLQRSGWNLEQGIGVDPLLHPGFLAVEQVERQRRFPRRGHHVHRRQRRGCGHLGHRGRAADQRRLRRQRATGAAAIGVFYGEYYDAFRDTAIDFAGSLTGREIEEQVYVRRARRVGQLPLPRRCHGSGRLLRARDQDPGDRGDPDPVQAGSWSAT